MLRGMPKPLVDEDSAPFWDGCANGQLLIPRCVPHHTPRWPPGPMCPVCQSKETEWIRASGEGSIYSWAVVTHPVDAVLLDQTPYVIALIDLPEGVRLLANVIDCPPSDIVSAMPVTLIFEDQDGLRIPNFRPVDRRSMSVSEGGTP